MADEPATASDGRVAELVDFYEDMASSRRQRRLPLISRLLQEAQARQDQAALQGAQGAQRHSSWDAQASASQAG